MGGSLVLQDWQQAEDFTARRLGEGAAYHSASVLQAIASLLESQGIVQRAGYTHRQTRPRDLNTRHIDDRDAALAKLPLIEALHALADAAQHPHCDQDRLLFALIVLLVTLGFRINEALTLPADCWHVADDGRAYLSYWPEKGGVLSPKWVPTSANDIVRDAIITITELTEPARQRAFVLARDTSRVPLLVPHSGDSVIGGQALIEALGMTGLTAKTVNQAYGAESLLEGKLHIPPTNRLSGPMKRRPLWKVSDLEQALASWMPEHRYEMTLPSGERLGLSNRLFVVPLRYFAHRPIMVLPQPVRVSALENFLGARSAGVKSVFVRYDLLDKEGCPWRLATHQFRHWINTVAHKGGLSGIELARWSGRRDPRQNRAYQHLDRDERIEFVK